LTTTESREFAVDKHCFIQTELEQIIRKISEKYTVQQKNRKSID